jgi:hypothetical protein
VWLEQALRIDMKSRPYVNQRIDALEAIFANSLVDLSTLKLLSEELSHRSVPRAAALKLKVAGAIAQAEGDQAVKTSKNPAAKRDLETDLEFINELELAEATDGFEEAVSQFARGLSKVIDGDHAAFDLSDLMEGEIEASELVTVAEAPIKNEPADIVEAWTALEVLSPQTYKKPEELWNGDPQSVARLNRPQLPWEVGEKAKKSTQLYYYVPLGALRVEEVTAQLLKKFGDKRPERTVKSGFACLACVTVDRQGRPLADNAIAVSSFAFGFQQTKLGALDKLKEWPAVERRVLEGLEKHLIRHENGEIQPLTKDVIVGAFKKLCATFTLEPTDVVLPEFALRVYQHFSVGGEPEPLLLNSFYLDDLARVRELVSQQKAPATLRQYLAIDRPGTQTDLLRNKDALKGVVSPAHTPLARWPSKGGHSLVLLQQAAVNAVRDRLKGNGAGLFAVNGPPGTGKTTLLRDIVADIVFSRAETLSQFNSPEDAFTHGGQYRMGQGFRHLYKIKDAIRGHEIIIASTNNKAVENVSRELPERDQIEEAYAPQYFRAIADNVAESEGACWGLAAAVLGNSSNRYEFQTRFWKHEDYGLQAYLYAAQGEKPVVVETDPQTGKQTERLSKIVALEKPPRDPDEALRQWASAVKNFKTVRTSVEERLTQLALFEAALDQIGGVESALYNAKSDFQTGDRTAETARVALADAQARASHAKAFSSQVSAELRQHRQRRPGLFARLFGSRQYRSWQDGESSLLEKTNSAARGLDASDAAAARARQNVESSAAHLVKLETTLADCQKRYDLFRAAIETARSKLGPSFADQEFWQRPHESFQISTAWLDAETQRLRDEAFVAAFDLHRAFIGGAAKQIRHNLNCLFDVLRGKGLPQDKADILPSLWSTLFLVTPVVSTTFASVGRMLKPMPPESIGWLMIDEAGQAVPQAAAGALMRARRAVVVGDPLQIEPVVSLSPSLVEKLSRAFGVDPTEWTAPDASTQRLADRAGPYATSFEREDAEIRVGAPLLVHRRCDEPMFGISNAVSYGRNMVSAVRTKPSKIGDVLGPSSWIHVASTSGSKWSTEEGSQVLDLLQSLAQAGVREPDIFIITPFRMVQDQMRQLVIRNADLVGQLSDRRAREWAFEQIGTVHTFQGREAESVIFLLGAPNQNQNGARSWAAWPPNILNVAVTRAKRTLYVVGNRDLWQSHGAFKTLSAQLPP